MRPARGRAARRRPADHGGRRDRRAALRRHPRQGVPARASRRPPSSARRRFGRRVQAVRRRRPVALDRRGPGARDRPDGDAPPAAAAASRCRSSGRRCSCSLLLIPLGVARLPRRRAAAPAARWRELPACWRRPASRRSAPRRRRPPPAPGALLLVRADRPRRRAGPAAGGRQRAARRGHRHPRLRRVGQHGRHRPASRPGWRRPRRPPARSSSASRRRVRIGVVAFSDSGLSGPGPDRRPGAGRWPRSTGSARSAGRRSRSGIQSALGGDRHGRARTRRPATTRTARPVRPSRPRRCPPGSHAAAVIVLLTDGENTTSPDPLAAAKVAADRGIRIYTVGHRQRAGATTRRRGFRVHTQLDEDLLRQIADHHRRHVLRGRDPDQLQAIYDAIQTRLVVRPEADGGHLALRGRRRCSSCSRRARVAALARAAAMIDRTLPRTPGRRDDRPAVAARPRPAPPRPGPGRVRIWLSAPPPGRRPLLQPVARPRGARRAVVAHPAPPAVRAVRARRRQPGPGRSRVRSRSCRVPAGQTTVDPRDRRLAQHVRDRHPAQPAAGRRGGRDQVHRRARARPPRSASSRSPASPRSSRRRRPTRRSCSTSITPDDRAADGGRQRHPRSRSTPSPRSTRPSPRARPMTRRRAAPPAPVPKGAYAPDIIVLLTDGASNAGPDPIDAAQQAADRGHPRLHDRLRDRRPGRPEPALRAAVHRRRAGRGRPRQRRPGGGGFGGGGGGGGGGTGFRRSIDEETLKRSRTRPVRPTTRPRARTSCSPSSSTCRRT